MSADPEIETTTGLGEPARRSERGLRPYQAVAVLGLLVWLWASVPLLVGQRTLYFRDVFLTHLPFKAFAAAELREGRIPALNPDWALGQPFRGNPNTVPYYPGNLLYLVLPFWIAFNGHYVLHWLLAAVSMAALARGLGRSPPASTLAALTYAGSGWMLSTLTFYNILTVVAWWPLVMLGVVRGGRRGLCLGGLACGLTLLGGEPVITAIALVPTIVVAASGCGWWRALLRTGAVGLLGALVSLPQVLATWRVLGFTFRGGYGSLASQVAHFSLHPGRLLELLVPFPFGLPGYLGEPGLQISSVVPHLPYFVSIHFGVVALILTLLAGRRRWPWLAVAGAGFLLAWLGGIDGTLLSRATLGLFRSPEKLLLWPALMIPLLAGAGLDRLLEKPSARLPWACAAGALAAIVLALLSWIQLPPPGVDAPVLHARFLVVGLSSAALLLAATAAVLWSARSRPTRTGWLVGVQLAALLQLSPLWLTDSSTVYRESALGAVEAKTDAAVIPVRQTYPTWRVEARRAPELSPGPPSALVRRQAADLSYAPAALYGATFPMAPDLDGTHHLFYNFMLYRVAEGSWRDRVAWARKVGADLIASPESIDHEGLQRLSWTDDGEHEALVYRVLDPAPTVWWPERLEVAASPGAAFDLAVQATEATGSVTAVAIVPQPVEHRPGGSARLLEHLPDRLVFDVETDGGLMMVRRSFQVIWEATVDGAETALLPADLCLVGVVVPPGRHQVVLQVSPGPERAGAQLAVATAVLLLLTGSRARPSHAAQRRADRPSG